MSRHTPPPPPARSPTFTTAPAEVERLRAENDNLRAGAKSFVRQVDRLTNGIKALHGGVREFESCPGPHGCADDACTESVHNGEWYHADQPVGHFCMTCRDEDGVPLDWPCETAALLNPTEGETDGR